MHPKLEHWNILTDLKGEIDNITINSMRLQYLMFNTGYITQTENQQRNIGLELL